MSLTSTELGKIVAGDLIIGDNTNGNITVEGIASTDTNQFTSVTLNATSSESSVIFENSASTFQTVTVNAGNGITLSSDLTTNGTTSFNSDSDANGTGVFTISAGQTLNSNNNSLTITSSNMALGTGSAINSGITTLLASQSSQAIRLGAGAVSGDFALSNAELGLITATNLTIGNNSNGTITLDNVTSFSGPLTLNATATGNAINFSGTASSGLGDITLNAGTGGVNFGVDAAITGTLSLSTLGTANATVTSNSALTLGASTIGGNLNVTVGGNNSLNVNGAIQTTGNTILRADDDIIFTAAGDINTTSGNIVVAADNDSDNNGSGGAMTMVNGTTFSSSTGTLALSADEDITLGLLTTSNSSTTSITLTSTNGGVRDSDTNALDINTGGRLVADLVTGFGTSDNAIETNLTSVDIDNSTSGDINIFESDAIDIFKIDHAGVGNVNVSFIKVATNQENATAFSGSVLFTRRDTGNLIVLDKTLTQRSNETTRQLFPQLEFSQPRYLDLDPARANRKELPPLDLFSEAKVLVEIDEKSAVYFDDLENLENVWEGTGVKNSQIAERKRSSKRVLARRPKATFEEEQVADISFRKTAEKSSPNFEDTSGRKKTSYQSSPKTPKRSPKPVFSLSQLDLFSFAP